MPARESQSRAPIYLLVGPDRFRKRARLEELASQLGVQALDRHEHGASELSAGALVTLLRGYPAASPRRVVIVEQAEELDEATARLLKEQLPVWSQTACLILLTDAALSAHPALAGLKSIATVETFSWLQPHEVGQWMIRELAVSRKRIAEDALGMLLQAHGADLPAIRGTLDQLVQWVDSRECIERADVEMFLETRSDAGHFAVIEGLVHRDVPGALKALDEQLRAGKDALEVLGLLVWQVQRWLTVRQLLDQGLPRERIAAIAGIQPWQLERTVAEVRGRSVELLRRMLAACWELDTAVKTGRVPSVRTALEALLVQWGSPSTPRWPALSRASGGDD